MRIRGLYSTFVWLLMLSLLVSVKVFANTGSESADILFNKGVALSEHDKLSEAITAYDELLTRFGKSEEVPTQLLCAKGLSNKGDMLIQLNRPTEAIATYKQVVEQYRYSAAATEVLMQDVIARALYSAGKTLNSQHYSGEESFSLIIRMYGNAPEPALQEWVAKALVSKGQDFFGIGYGYEQYKHNGNSYAIKATASYVEAVDTFNDVIKRFGTSNSIALQRQVAQAYLYKGFAIRAQGKLDETIAVLEELIKKFKDISDAKVRDIINQAQATKENAVEMKTPN